MKASILKYEFNKIMDNLTEETVGKFKLQVFFAGVAFDNGTTIVFKDGSIADFTDRDNLKKIKFNIVRV